jgi:DNA replication protein DnaC
LLVIDDWGKNQGGAYQEASLFDVIDARYRLQHPTLVTTNCDLRDIDGAIVSRFSTGLIACNGEDQRRHGHGAI